MTRHRHVAASLCLLALTALATTAAPATAQAQTTAPAAPVAGGTSGQTLQAGTSAIALNWLVGNNPYATNSAGFWHLFTPSLAVGLNLGLQIQDGGDPLTGSAAGGAGGLGLIGDWQAVVAPALKYYFHTGTQTVPFLFGKVNLAFADLGPEYVGLVLGGGAEWFPTAFFSLGGYVGLNLNLVEDFGLGLLTSSLAATFYF